MFWFFGKKKREEKRLAEEELAKKKEIAIARANEKQAAENKEKQEAEKKNTDIKVVSLKAEKPLDNVKTEPKLEVKTETLKPEVKAEVKPEPTPAPKKEEPKVEKAKEVKPEPKPQPKPEPKKEVKPEKAATTKKSEKAEKTATVQPKPEKVTKTKAVIKKEEPKPEKAEKQPRAGKWVIEKKAESEYISCLLANNGEIMLTSEIYSSEEGAKNGISTIIKNVEVGKFIIYTDKKNNYYYKLKTAGNKLLCIGEIYTTKSSCENAVTRVKLIASISPISPETIESQQYIAYQPDPDFKKAKTEGKWRIVKEETGFVAKLYASNGELLLASEGLSSEMAAKSALENIQRNVKANNFVIDRDKSGKFYYKLRNSQKNTLCVGESYSTLSSCTSAIESVKKFCDGKIAE